MGVSVLRLHLKEGSEDDGGTTSGGGVHWASVEALLLPLIEGNSGDVHNWHDGVELLKLHLS